MYNKHSTSQATIPAPSLPSSWPITQASLSVILPAYNEEAVIEQTIRATITQLNAWLEHFEVIVVNDGSRDRTGSIVAKLAAADQRIRLIEHPVNQGYGAALASGFAAVKNELAFFMDSDGQFDISELAGFFPLLEEYDAVLGYRINRQDTWMRKFNAWGWKMLVRLVFGIRVRDIDCAFKLYRSDFFQKHALETCGAMINVEMLYKFTRVGYSYTEVGVHHLPRTTGKATGARLSVILRAFREMLFYARKWQQEKQ